MNKNKFNEQVGSKGANSSTAKIGTSKCSCPPTTSNLNTVPVPCLPLGSILLWSGAYTGPIAYGGAVYDRCDGTGITPDLTDLFIVGASVAQPENTTGGQASVSYVLGENNLPDHTHYLFDDGQADGIAATPYPGFNPPGGNYPTPVQMSKGGLHVPFPGSWINLSCVGYGTPGTIAPTQGFAPETTTGGCTAATGTITGGTAAPLVYPTIPTYYALYYLMRIA